MRIKLDKNAHVLVRAHADDAGLDIFSPAEYNISPGGYCVIDTGVHVQIPVACCGILKSKSGLSVKEQIHTVDGVIDCGYTGSIVVKLHNGDRYKYAHIKAGQKITQLLIIPCLSPVVEIVENVDDLYQCDTDRGDSGFGSTGE